MTTADRRQALLALLVAYSPHDAAERGYLARMQDLAAALTDPFARDAFAPGHFTASAFVVHPSQSRLLMVHHAKLGRWLQPGGHIDPGDTGPGAAAGREVAEETGITALEAGGGGLLDVDVHLFPARPGGDPRHEHFDLRFLFRARDTVAAPGEEVRDVGWVSLAGLDGMGVDRSVLRPAAKALGDLS